MNFNGTLAVVTGGASGIGAACASFFKSHGARVVIADRNHAAAAKMAAELDVSAATMDVTSEDSVEQAAESIERDFGEVGILVNSAGVLQRTLPPEALSMKEWDFVLDVDLRGTYLCCVSFGKRMRLRRRGAIVNIASVAGMRSGPLHGYGPAKAGVLSMTECLAAEWGPGGIRVNAVSPGFTLTPALEKGFATHTLAEQALTDSSALGRLVQAEEIAAAVGFLASDLASAITGINLPVDAGYLVATPWASYGGLRRN